MRFGSLFSGIEAASAAWLPLGWSCAWVAEIDPFARAVLAHHYPDTPNLGDVNRIDPDAVEPVDLVVFGSPCQSFSVAGKRLGLDDPRGNMALVGLRLIGRIRPRWVVWENVPGVLSSDGGRDFGAFLGLLGELGYGFAYRVLDAQHAGVPQRRRRVFVVGCLGDWRGAAAVLFEPESLRGDPPPRREAGERVADPITRSFAKHGGASAGQDGDPMYSLQAGAQHGVMTAALAAFQSSQSGVRLGEQHATLDSNNGSRRHHGALQGMSVRRLTPGECLKLQGFPPDYLDIQYRGKPAADGNKYRATGNSMAVPVVAWLGRRIQQFTEQEATDAE